MLELKISELRLNNLGVNANWALDIAIEIDRHVPGFCGNFFRVSNERRQVIAAYLSGKPPLKKQLEEVGHFLLRAGHQTILEKTYGGYVRGLRGALRRSGPAVHKQAFYVLLQRLLRDPVRSPRRTCIERLPSLDWRLLEIVETLAPHICRANVVHAIGNVDDAKDVKKAVELLVSRGADEAELCEAICQSRDGAALARVFQRAVLKCRAPAHPVPASDSYIPVVSTEQLARLGRRYRNCARSYLVDLLDADAGHAFAECVHEGEGVVVHLRKERDEWRLSGIFGRRNKRPSEGAHTHVLAHLRAHGIPSREEKCSQAKWEAVRRLAEPALDFNLW